MMWFWLSISKFFSKIGNYFYYKHLNALQIKRKKNVKIKSNKILCKKCMSTFGSQEVMERKEIKHIATRPSDNKTVNITEYWHVCNRCKAKTKKVLE
jgi:hypothetical protein